MKHYPMLQVSHPNPFHFAFDNNLFSVIGCYICKYHLVQFLKSFLSSSLQFLDLFSLHWLLWKCLAATFASTSRKRGMFRSRCDFDLTESSPDT